MPVSTLDIVNAALDLIGQGSLTALEEASPLAEKVRRLWPLCLEETLRAHFWKCASRRVNLNPLAEIPAFGFKRAFALPGDFIRLENTEPRARVRIEGRTLLADVNKIAVLYVARLEDSTLYDASLRQCLSLKLAAMMAYGASASTALAQEMEVRYRDKLREARAFDSMEGSGDDPPLSNWAEAKLR